MTAHLRDSVEAGSFSAIDSPKVECGIVFEAQLKGAAGFYRNFGKRTFDLVFVMATAPLAVVLIGIAALLTAFDGFTPFYWQQRVGRNGRPYWMLKIRTMVPYADRHLQEFLAQQPEALAEWNEKQKLRDDPRITFLGRLLRKTSLDELPQLWNVLLGDMSIVGPRPMMMDQRSLYPGCAYYALRPGITGSWQVSDRNECSFAGRAAFDNTYNATLSFKTDLEILARTVSVILRCTGR